MCSSGEKSHALLINVALAGSTAIAMIATHEIMHRYHMGFSGISDHRKFIINASEAFPKRGAQL